MVLCTSFRKLTYKRYLRKTVYRYERYLLPIPSKYKDVVKPFLNRDLEVYLTVERDYLNIRVKELLGHKNIQSTMIYITI
ncbi:hypothetical protein KEJ48_06675 [Candidatus Bathyarchaeota archaeon]|nr:hypothetical protein [Candidatus Bathyarchaeota archaeon]